MVHDSEEVFDEWSLHTHTGTWQMHLHALLELAKLKKATVTSEGVPRRQRPEVTLGVGLSLIEVGLAWVHTCKASYRAVHFT